MKLKSTTHTLLNAMQQFKQRGPIKKKVSYDKQYNIAKIRSLRGLCNKSLQILTKMNQEYEYVTNE